MYCVVFLFIIKQLAECSHLQHFNEMMCITDPTKVGTFIKTFTQRQKVECM